MVEMKNIEEKGIFLYQMLSSISMLFFAYQPKLMTLFDRSMYIFEYCSKKDGFI